MSSKSIFLVRSLYFNLVGRCESNISRNFRYPRCFLLFQAYLYFHRFVNRLSSQAGVCRTPCVISILSILNLDLPAPELSYRRHISPGGSISFFLQDTPCVMCARFRSTVHPVGCREVKNGSIWFECDVPEPCNLSNPKSRPYPSESSHLHQLGRTLL